MGFLRRLLGRRVPLETMTARLERVALEGQALRQRRSALFDELSKAFFEVDPVGINFDDNTDEYDAEVGTVLPRLGDARSSSDVDKILREEFAIWFDGVSIDRTRMSKLAERVWDIWSRSAAPTSDIPRR